MRRGMEVHVFVLAVGLLCVSGELYIGDDCTLNDDSQGVCKTLVGCPGALAEISRGALPKVCSYVQNTPIVCCNQETATTESSTGQSTTQPGPSVKLNADFRTKTGQKCKLYSRYVFWETSAPVLTVFNQIFNETVCAMTVQKLIVGGMVAEPMEFPHMAALGFGDEGSIQWQCGGSLISKRYILTAAHCLSTRSGPVRWARLGDSNLERSDDNVEAVTIGIAERIKHPDYVGSAFYNDIALLKLKSDVTFSRFIRPACLYTKPGNPPQMPNATASGWGKMTHSGETGSPDLLKVDLTLQHPARCNDTFEFLIKASSKLKKGITAENMICAGSPLGKDTCQGDSGGPLQVRLTNPYCMYSIIGVTSFGSSACGIGDNPAVYTRVSFYVPWIEKIVWP